MDRSFNRERFFYIMLPSPAAPHFTRHNLNSLCISRSRFSTSASSQQSLYQPLPIFDQRIIPAASVSAAPHFRPAHHPSSLCISRSPFSTSTSSQQPLYQPLPIFDQRIIPAASVSTAPIFDQPIISAASVSAAPHFRPDTSISIKLRHGIVVLCVLSVATPGGS